MSLIGREGDVRKNAACAWDKLPAELRVEIARYELDEWPSKIKIGRIWDINCGRWVRFIEPGILSVNRQARGELRDFFYSAHIHTLEKTLNFERLLTTPTSISCMLRSVKRTKDSFDQPTPAKLRLNVLNANQYELSCLAIVPRLVCMCDFTAVEEAPTLEIYISKRGAKETGSRDFRRRLCALLQALRDAAQDWKGLGLDAVAIEKRTLQWIWQRHEQGEMNEDMIVADEAGDEEDRFAEVTHRLYHQVPVSEAVASIVVYWALPSGGPTTQGIQQAFERLTKISE